MDAAIKPAAPVMHLLDDKLREEQQRLKASSDLELLSWHWSSEHGYATEEGEVKNISGKKLERIEALVTWYEKDGTMITSDRSLIEYDPLLRGQTSFFKVYERYNQEMNSARIEFKFMWAAKSQHIIEKVINLNIGNAVREIGVRIGVI